MSAKAWNMHLNLSFLKVWEFNEDNEKITGKWAKLEYNIPKFFPYTVCIKM